MNRLRVLHVVPRLNRGGGGASVLHEWAETGDTIDHQFLSLEREVDVSMLRDAMRRRIRVHQAPSAEDLTALLTTADIVLLHFWQCPSVFEFLTLIHGLKLRLILYSHTRGTTPPQILVPDVLALTDGWISSAPPELPYAGPQLWMPSLVDPALEAAPPPRPQAPFRLAHCNTLNPSKLHPAFVTLHAGFDVDIYGVGGGEAALTALPGATLHGFVPDWWQTTHACALTHPLHPCVSSTADKVVQEAMFCAMPVVLIEPTGLSALVGDAGLVARDAEDFQRILCNLRDDMEFRLAAGTAAREHALLNLSPRKSARRLAAFYAEIAANPPTEKSFSVSREDYLAQIHPADAPEAFAWHIAHAEGGTHHWAKFSRSA